MKHSKLDLFLVLLLGLQISLFVIPFFIPFTPLQLVGMGLLNIYMMGTNYQCIAHNFIHIPFFKANILNQIFSMFNTIGIGVPQSLYRIHHLNHHRYNNHPDTDESSTFKYGKNGKEENIFTYSLLGVIRTDLGALYKSARKQSALPIMEILFLTYFVGTLVAINWKLVVFYLVPSIFLGQVFAVWENYCEHHRAPLNDRKRDSVSCYNEFYNFIWFNNGYHQEHHFSPQVHWTEIRKVKSQLPDDRVIVKGCHLMNSFTK